MEGDLIELSRTHSPLWQGVHTALVATAMAMRAFAKAPVSIFLIGIAGFASLYVGVLAGEVLTFSPVGSYLSSEAMLSVMPFRMSMLALTAAPASFLAGFAIVRLSPLRGATAALLALLLFGAFLVMLQIYVFSPEMLIATFLKMIFAGLPFLLGSAVAHRGRLRRSRSA